MLYEGTAHLQEMHQATLSSKDWIDTEIVVLGQPHSCSYQHQRRHRQHLGQQHLSIQVKNG
jgi:hypothetical protein